MSQSMEETPLREVAILTRAVENVFRKLIRLLVGWMSLVKLQEMLRIVFVEEAERKLKKESPEKNVSLTKLALLTGLDTRTLKKLIDDKEDSANQHKKDKFLRAITPESSVLDYWSNSSKYLDKKSSKPLILKISGDVPSFESLMIDVNTSRGVTKSSLLSNLEKVKSIRIDLESQTVCLLNRQFLYFENKEAVASVEVGLAAVGNLLETLVHNFATGRLPSDLFFERSNWTHRLNLKDLHSFRREVRTFLVKAEENSLEILGAFEEDEIGENQMTAGISMFYFEDQGLI